MTDLQIVKAALELAYRTAIVASQWNQYKAALEALERLSSETVPITSCTDSNGKSQF